MWDEDMGLGHEMGSWDEDVRQGLGQGWGCGTVM